MTGNDTKAKGMTMRATTVTNADFVLAKMAGGATMHRGNSGGWYLYRGLTRLGRVIGKAADEVIDSGRVTRTDDRTTVVGETYAINDNNNNTKVTARAEVACDVENCPDAHLCRHGVDA